MGQLQRQDFDVLKYKLPPRASSEYAIDAISILKNFDVQILPYLLSSDIVLTLSGVRAYDTYISFEGLDSSEITKIKDTFKLHEITLESESYEYAEPISFYSLINHAALKALPTQYTFSNWVTPNPPYTIDRMYAWAYYIEQKLFDMMAKGELPKEWLSDHHSAHNVRFGILLGYPGEAIACGCWMEVFGENKMPNTLSSTLTYHDAYDAAWPTYYYTEAVKDNPNIQAHQKLWSAILSNVYESDWHKALMSDPVFKDAVERVHSFKEPLDSRIS